MWSISTLCDFKICFKSSDFFWNLVVFINVSFNVLKMNNIFYYNVLIYIYIIIIDFKVVAIGKCFFD